MPWRDPKTWGEIVTQLVLLQTRFDNIYDSLGYQVPVNGEIKDVRSATIGNCKTDVTINIMILNPIAGLAQGTIPEEKFRSNIGLTDPNTPLHIITNKISDYLRLSLAANFQFRVENLFANLIAELSQEKVPRDYLQKASALLNILSLEGSERKLDRLKVLQFIRNSLHNNGYHYNNSFRITIDDLTFHFVKGGMVRCAGWQHVIVAIEASLLVIEEILNSPQVKAIPGPIRTYFVQNLSSNPAE
jgi:hypothetical protein